MPTKILVTYAGQGGSTAGVAEAIANTLTAAGEEGTLLPVQEVLGLSPYRAVVLGSAIHSGKWLPAALAFIRANQAALRQMPVAIFQVCLLPATGNPTYQRLAQEWLEPVRAQLNPQAAASFTGALFPERYPRLSDKLGLRIFLAAVQLKAGDYRDWAAIRRWAQSLRLSPGLDTGR